MARRREASVVAKLVSAISNHFVDRRSHPAEEWLLVAVLLSATGGYLDAFTWLMHGVLATVQSARLSITFPPSSPVWSGFLWRTTSG
jgi:uncharacterized membrane protein YoaK (UPF0700 family)